MKTKPILRFGCVALGSHGEKTIVKAVGLGAATHKMSNKANLRRVLR